MGRHHGTAFHAEARGGNLRLTPTAISGLHLLSGGKAYYCNQGPLSIVGVGLFKENADHSTLTVPADMVVTFGADFKLMAGVAELTGSSDQYKVYVIQRVFISEVGFIYAVTGAIFG